MERIIKTPWGLEELLFKSSDVDWIVKRLVVKKGHRTSLQYHKRKNEFMFFKDGDWKYIPAGERHRLTGPVEVIEVSDAGYENDIVRLEDDYGRVKKRLA